MKFPDEIGVVSPQARSDVTVYVDERGTPGMAGLFVIAGVVLWGDVAITQATWEDFLRTSKLGKRRSRRYSEDQLLELVEQLVRLDAVPLGVHSILTKADATRLQTEAKAYRDLQSPNKVAPRIAPASWMWKCQLSAFMTRATAAAVDWVGPLREFSVQVDQFNDRPQVRARYEELMRSKISAAGRASARRAELPDTPLERRVAEVFGSRDWKLNLEARGKLGVMADVACTIYARHLEEGSKAWEVWCMKYLVKNRPVPPYTSTDVTAEVRDFVDKMEQARAVQQHTED